MADKIHKTSIDAANSIIDESNEKKYTAQEIKDDFYGVSSEERALIENDKKALEQQKQDEISKYADEISRFYPHKASREDVLKTLLHFYDEQTSNAILDEIDNRIKKKGGK